MLAALIVPWLAAGAVATRFGPGLEDASHRAELGAVMVMCALLIAAGGALLLMPSTKESHRRAIGFAAGILAPLAAIVALQTGGTRSVAFIAAAVCALGTGAAAGWAGAVLTSIGSLAVVLGVPWWLGGTLTLSDFAFGLAVIGTVTALPFVSIQRSLQHGTLNTLAELPSFATAPSDTAVATPSAVPQSLFESDVAEHQSRSDALARYLRQVRDTLGVTDAVYWRMTKDGKALTPLAWASEGHDPWHAHTDALGSHLAGVQSASRVLQMDHLGDGKIAAVGVSGPANSTGVLTLHAKKFAVSHDVLERWLPRFADNLGLIAQLLETQAEHGRQNRQTQALLQASQNFQQQRTIDTLGQSICDSALTVTGASRAALVRWYPETGSGVVQSVTSGHHLQRGATVVADSLVGQLCNVGLPQVWEDAEHLERVTAVFSSATPLRNTGSLGIVPLKQTDGVSGAIVVESEAVGGVLSRDIRNVRLLGAIASVSLETVWQIEEATRRARTDALTGLNNRRAFDEALARSLAEADRFGHNVGLVICDVDNFKRVNDLYGHEVGDHVLRSIAATLSAGTRGVDMVARYGGEELVLLLGKADVAMAWEVAERMRAAIEAKSIGVGEHLVHVTASFGVAAYPETARLGDDLFPAADRALYAAKREGRNCVRFARPLGSEPAAEGEV